jgi:multidrug resistance efflux pump
MLELMTRTAAFALLIASAAPTFAQNAAPGVLKLGLPASAVIKEISVADGAHVDAGAILLKLDCRLVEEEIKLRTANLEAARAVHDKARNGARADEIAIGLANVGVAAARAEEADAAFRRLSQLAEGVAITRAQLLQARREARVTAAQLEDAQKRLALLRAGTRSEEIMESSAKQEAAEASLGAAKVQLDQCALKAPAPGRVKFVATLGQFISAAVPVTLVELTPDSMR